MGNDTVIKVLVRYPESVNFDKICCLTLKLVHVRKLPLGDIIVVGEGDHDVDIEGEKRDREYWKLGARSMTELYAIHGGLGTPGVRTLDAPPLPSVDVETGVCVASDIPGLVSLCQSLAENHGKVPGVTGGSLYKKGMISVFAKELATIPDHASEIVDRLVKAVAASLKDADPVASFRTAAGKEWDRLDDALAAAGRADYEKARDMARALQSGRCAHGNTFPLAQANGQYAPQGIALETRNPNLMKHLWSAIKAMGPSFLVATAVVSHPDTKRIAVLSSTQYPVDVGPVAKMLKKRFPKAEFDVNLERGSIIWDPRSRDARGPTPQDMQEIVSKHLSFGRGESEVRSSSVGATLGDAHRLRARQRNR